jgi:hypothetical protein
MKKLLFSLLLISSVAFSQTHTFYIPGLFAHPSTPAVTGNHYYVDPSSGSSFATGSLETPWKTLSQVQVNMSLFNPGDIISFKKGQTFPGTFTISRSGTAGNPILFNAYGSGAAPIFSGTGSTINSLVYLNNRSYITIDGINVTDPSISPTDRTIPSKIQRGFYVDGNSNNIIIQNCSISLVGVGAYFVGPSNILQSCNIGNMRMVRNTPTNVNDNDDYGANPVVISSANNKIWNNYFHDCWATSYDYLYDGGAVEFFGPGTNGNSVMFNTMEDCNGLMEFGSSDGGTSANNIIAYNKLINNGSLVYINNSGEFAITVTNLQFYNNVIVENVAQRLFETFLISLASGSATSGIIVMKNNIFWTTTGIDIARSSQFTGSQMTHETNIYHLGAGSVLNYTIGGSELSTSNALFTNTADADPVNWDYHLPLGSEAIDFGQTIAGLTVDYASVVLTGTREAGIYEYVTIVFIGTDPTGPPRVRLPFFTWFQPSKTIRLKANRSGSFFLLNTLGQLMATGYYKVGKTEISTAKFLPGIYYLKTEQGVFPIANL